jgi:hypothetical protein
MKKSKFTEVELEQIKAIQEKLACTRKTAIRKFKQSLEAAKQAQPKSKAVSKPQSQKTTNANRAAGIALFNLAGRPSKSDFIKVYGKRGHLMTWTEREAAGVSAEDFQKALASR